MGNSFSSSTNVQTWRCADRRMGGARMQGRRGGMEDFDVHVAGFVNPAWDLLVVLDGHGGSSVAARVASRLPEVLAMHLKPDDSVEAIQKAMDRAFEQVDTELLATEEPTRDCSGACCSLALVTPSHFIIAFCGDCVGFLLRVASDGLRMTNLLGWDHEPSLPEERARIEAAGSRVHLDGIMPRVDGDLNVSRAFGDAFWKTETRRAPPRFVDGCFVDQPPITGLSHKTFPITAAPDFCVVPRAASDVMLVLGSDGLVDFGMTTDKFRVVDRLWQAVQLEGMSDATALATLAVDTAYLNHSSDNITALVWLAELPEPWRNPRAAEEWVAYMKGRNARLRGPDTEEPDPFPAEHAEV